MILTLVLMTIAVVLAYALGFWAGYNSLKKTARNKPWKLY